MPPFLTIVRNDLGIFFSQRGNLVGLLVTPTLLTLVIGWSLGQIGGGGTPRTRVDLIDLDRTALSARLVDAVRAGDESLVLCPADNDADDYCRLGEAPLDLERAIARARDGRTAAAIVIPAGYAAALDSFQKASISYYSTSDPLQPDPALQSLGAALQRAGTASMTTGVGGALLDNLSADLGISFADEAARTDFLRDLYRNAERTLSQQPAPVRFVTAGAPAEAGGAPANGFNQSAPGMGSLYVMFTVLGGMSVLLRERNQWTMQRLLAMPIARAHILAGKIGVYFTLGMAQYCIVFVVGRAAGMDFGGSPLALLAVMAAFVLCITALTFALAPRIKSQGQARGLTLLLSLSLAPLGGAWWPLEIVPEFMQILGHVSPVAWAMDGFHDLIWRNGGLADALPEIGVLLAASGLLFVFGIRGFRYQ